MYCEIRTTYPNSEFLFLFKIFGKYSFVFTSNIYMHKVRPSLLVRTITQSGITKNYTTEFVLKLLVWCVSYMYCNLILEKSHLGPTFCKRKKPCYFHANFCKHLQPKTPPPLSKFKISAFFQKIILIHAPYSHSKQCLLCVQPMPHIVWCSFYLIIVF